MKDTDNTAKQTETACVVTTKKKSPKNVTKWSEMRIFPNEQAARNWTSSYNETLTDAEQHYISHEFSEAESFLSHESN